MSQTYRIPDEWSCEVGGTLANICPEEIGLAQKCCLRGIIKTSCRCVKMTHDGHSD